MAFEELQDRLGDLRKDLKTNISQLGSITDVAGLASHLKETLYPMLEEIVEVSSGITAETSDLEEAVLELAQGEGDMLTPETAGVFANVLILADQIAETLKARIKPEETELSANIDNFRQLLLHAGETLQEITIADEEEEDENADPAGQ